MVPYLAGHVEWLLVFGLLMLFLLAISWLSAILGLIVKSRETANWTRFIVAFPITFVSSAFVPTDTMPSELRVFAEKPTPLTHVIQAMRVWLVDTPVGNSHKLAFVCSASLFDKIGYLTRIINQYSDNTS